MPLSLQTVPPRQGLRWLRDGFQLFSRFPLPFSFLFVVFMAAAALGSALPLFGGFIMLCAVPLLSLGFMIASESALTGGPIHPGQYVAALRTDAPRRRSQLILCLLFGSLTLGVLWLSHTLDGGTFAQLQKLMAEDAPKAKIDAVLSDPALLTGMIMRLGLAALMSVPFWHAPALVHWGGQGPGQALFSSTLAVWRCKGAFGVYSLAWFAVVAVFGMLVALVLELMGGRQYIGLVILPAGLVFSTVFYVSLIFTFNDSFDGTSLRSPLVAS